MKYDIIFAACLFWCHSKEPLRVWKDVHFKQFVPFVYF